MMKLFSNRSMLLCHQSIPRSSVKLHQLFCSCIQKPEKCDKFLKTINTHCPTPTHSYSLFLPIFFSFLLSLSLSHTSSHSPSLFPIAATPKKQPLFRCRGRQNVEIPENIATTLKTPPFFRCRDSYYPPRDVASLAKSACRVGRANGRAGAMLRRRAARGIVNGRGPSASLGGIYRRNIAPARTSSTVLLIRHGHVTTHDDNSAFFRSVSR